ncbi:hypothetical protein ACYZUC_20855 [Pseudomonas sp. GT1P32]
MNQVTALNGPGTIDKTFADAGVAVLLEGVRTVLALPDKKLLIASKTAVSAPLIVTRLTEAGVPDESFGSGGSREIAVGSRRFFPTQMYLFASGEFLIVGTETGSTPDNLYVARLSADGQLVPRFGENGIVTLKASDIAEIGEGASFLHGGEEGATGDFIFFGSPWLSVSDQEQKIYLSSGIRSQAPLTAVVYRLNEKDGTKDTSFNGGYVLMEKPGADSFVRFGALAVHGDGVLVAGAFVISGGPPEGDVFLTRYDGKGNVDSAFGNNGTVTVVNGDDGRRSLLTSIAVSRDDVIVASGYSNTGTAREGLLIVLNRSGSFNQVFNKGQPLYADFLARLSFHECAFQREKMIVVTGLGEDGYIVVARYDLNGFLDLTFGGTGWAIFRESWSSQYLDRALTADNKIVILGVISLDYAVRYLG